jgi:hypothetical protein
VTTDGPTKATFPAETGEAQWAPRTLRVGVLVDGFEQPAWIRSILEEIRGFSGAEIVLVVRNLAVPPRYGFARRVWNQRAHLLAGVYQFVDARVYRPRPDASALGDVSDLLAGVPVLDVAPIARGWCDWFPDADVDAIAAHDLDVVLRFGFRIVKGRILGVARFGMWSYHHGDNRVNRGGPPGFWEVIEGDPVTGSVLQVLSEELDGGRVIYRSYASTARNSVTSNRNGYYWKTARFMGRKLRDLHERGPSAIRGEPADAVHAPYSHRLYRPGRNLEMAPALLRFGARVAGHVLGRWLNHEQWTLGLRVRSPAGGMDTTLYRFELLRPPRDRFWADPFPVRHGDGYLVFLEELEYRAVRGHISVMEVDSRGGWTRPVKVLERPYHLSYPFVFQWNGDWWMIPETQENRAVELYRAHAFPHDWRLEKVLLPDVNAVDATLAEIGGRWWMFATIAVEGASLNDELHLFHAPGPLGPWEPHRGNPVKSDVRSARPAGRVFQAGDDWFRPAQDCSRRYGYAVVLHRIDELTPDTYREAEVSRILPHWRRDVLGTHTLNSAEGLTVVDALVRRNRLAQLFARD